MAEQEAKDAAQSGGGLFSSFWGSSSEATQKAWGLWESVKSNPHIQQAQQQAQSAWNNYDQEKVKEKLAELGKSATTYIDEADRKLESMELGALHYLQERGTEIVDKVKEATLGEQHDGEVLFNGPSSMSRLDSELLALNSSPDQILAFTTTTPATTSTTAATAKTDGQKFLKSSSELRETYESLVPSKLSEDEFWSRYMSLRTKLEDQDRRRKQLIQNHHGKEDELDDWGSSEEDTSAPTDPKKKTEKKIEEEGSDSDWE